MSVDFAAAYRAENEALAELCGVSGPDLDIPSCPGWTTRTLVTHVGRGDRWAATIVRDRSSGPVDPRAAADGKAPVEFGAALDWLRAGVGQLTDAVDADDDSTVWTFTGPKPSSWWLRRRLHETVVHRADVALAAGADFQLDATLAADSIDELLAIFAVRPAPPAPLAPGMTLQLEQSDGHAVWRIRGTASGVALEPAAPDATVTLRAPAPDLLLALMRRLPADDARLSVTGDAGVWATWRELTRF